MASNYEQKECEELKETFKSLILELSDMQQNHKSANEAGVGAKRAFLDAKKVNLSKCEKWQSDLKATFKNAKIKKDALKNDDGVSALSQEFVSAVRHPDKQDTLKLLKRFMVKMQKMQPTYIAEMHEWAVQNNHPKPVDKWPNFTEQVCIRITNIITGAPGSGAYYIKPTKCGGQYFKKL